SDEGEKEQYYEEFLSEKRVELITEYLKEYMDREYPGIGYGTTYEEITMDRLRNDRVAVGEEFEEIDDALYSSYDIHLTSVMYNIVFEMRENGDLSGNETFHLEDEIKEALKEEGKWVE
ncbi:MAG: hypothetical protein ACK5LL_15110, partial [Suipraeoptans sp.]